MSRRKNYIKNIDKIKNSSIEEKKITTELEVCNKEMLLKKKTEQDEKIKADATLAREKQNNNENNILGLEPRKIYTKEYYLTLQHLRFRESINKNLLRTSYASELLLGGSSENTKNIWRSNILLSKNNIEVFNNIPVKMRLFILEASLKWFANEFMVFRMMPYKKFNLMFASRTPAFSNLMLWGGFTTNCASSGNRWLPGRISAQTNLQSLPNYLFIPDPDENLMIVQEAWRKKIPIISINCSDSKVIADLGIYANNKSFKSIVKLMMMVVKFSKNRLPQKKEVKNKWLHLVS